MLVAPLPKYPLDLYLSQREKHLKTKRDEKRGLCYGKGGTAMGSTLRS